MVVEGDLMEDQSPVEFCNFSVKPELIYHILLFQCLGSQADHVACHVLEID